MVDPVLFVFESHVLYSRILYVFVVHFFIDLMEVFYIDLSKVLIP